MNNNSTFQFSLIGNLEFTKMLLLFQFLTSMKREETRKRSSTLTAGTDVKLICNIRTTGQTSKPVYYWLKDNQVLILSDHHRMRLKPYRYLGITSAKKKDSGIYICGAVNNCGWNTYTMQLFVGSE